MKETEQPLKLKKGGHEWNAYLTVDSSDKPCLLVFDDGLKFEDLINAPLLELIYRSNRKNEFKGRVKKTTYNLIQGETQFTVDCKHDERNVNTAIISGKGKEIRNGKKLKDQT